MIFISQNLKFLREWRGWAQNRCADLLGVKPNVWSNWENNVNYPKVEFMVKIAREFNISVDSLITENLKEKEEQEDLSNLPQNATDIKPEYLPSSCNLCDERAEIISTQKELIESLKSHNNLLQEMLNKQ